MYVTCTHRLLMINQGIQRILKVDKMWDICLTLSSFSTSSSSFCKVKNHVTQLILLLSFVEVSMSLLFFLCACKQKGFKCTANVPTTLLGSHLFQSSQYQAFCRIQFLRLRSLHHIPPAINSRNRDTLISCIITHCVLYYGKCDLLQQHSMTQG